MPMHLGSAILECTVDADVFANLTTELSFCTTELNFLYYGALFLYYEA